MIITPEVSQCTCKPFMTVALHTSPNETCAVMLWGQWLECCSFSRENQKHLSFQNFTNNLLKLRIYVCILIFITTVVIYDSLFTG